MYAIAEDDDVLSSVKRKRLQLVCRDEVIKLINDKSKKLIRMRYYEYPD